MSSGIRRNTEVLVIGTRDDIRAERVYIDYPINTLDRVTYDDLIELTMLDFDIIFGIDWLHMCYATIDYQNRVVSVAK